MLVRLEAAFVQVRRFAADAAHELRTPLTALSGGLEVALRTDRSPDEYRRVLRVGPREVAQLVRLAEDLSLLSRASAGGLVRPDRWISRRCVLEVVDAGARLAKGRGVTVRLGAVEPAVVTGDAVALERALLNLVDNAVKYTPAGGKVEISPARPTAGWRSPSRTAARASRRPTPSASSSHSSGSTRRGPAGRRAPGSVWRSLDPSWRPTAAP